MGLALPESSAVVLGFVVLFDLLSNRFIFFHFLITVVFVISSRNLPFYVVTGHNINSVHANSKLLRNLSPPPYQDC